MHDLSIYETAKQLGYRLDPNKRGFGPCPFCGQETRHRKTGDKRGACSINQRDIGWVCLQCEQTGDSATLIKLSDNKTIIPQAPEPKELKEEYKLIKDKLALSAQLWLASRDLSKYIDDQDLCDRVGVFGTNKITNSWYKNGYTLAVSLSDHETNEKNCQARYTGTEQKAKTLFPFGVTTTGLLFLNDKAKKAIKEKLFNVAVICEGLPDYLTLCQHYVSSCIFGILSGSFTSEILDIFSKYKELYVVTHNDDQGTRYLEKIISSKAKKIFYSNYDINDLWMETQTMLELKDFKKVV